ncbi:MAG TPA: L-seryl-tRNA(Sec) selenium transferase [Chthonomonadaceae bacterium]|nr:L-seryl-tRNA(Sec) selenium transferase [Chthonomonadaceae bacterium]
MKATKEDNNPLRSLPSVHRLLAAPAVRAIGARVPAPVLTEAARSVLEAVRAELVAGNGRGVATPSEAELAERVVAEAQRRAAPSLQAAVNATGIVLHTGLGRARLSAAAQRAVQEVAAAHAVLEIERETGRRGSRRDHVRGLLCELTGAEDATVVNNCAGAVFLAVMTLAAGREVLISRGELVEIGGAFRMPDIIRASGATLVEVGTTNRTRLSDYANAITERTGLILRCHPSNFAIVGFTEEVPTAALAALSKEHGLPVMDDQGSGALIAPSELGIGGQKGSLKDSLAAGCEVVTASGDKLLGGPQAGLILGRREPIERIAKHPLARALRVDKLTLAALEATLCLYREPDRALAEIPTLRYLTRTEPELRRLAQRLKTKLQTALPPDRFLLTLVPERSQIGGGSLPGEDLPTVCVALRALDGVPSPDEIAAHLRHHTPPIFARIKADAVLFDPRTLEPEELDFIAQAVRNL